MNYIDLFSLFFNNFSKKELEYFKKDLIYLNMDRNPINSILEDYILIGYYKDLYKDYSTSFYATISVSFEHGRLYYMPFEKKIIDKHIRIQKLNRLKIRI